MKTAVEGLREAEEALEVVKEAGFDGARRKAMWIQKASQSIMLESFREIVSI